MFSMERLRSRVFPPMERNRLDIALSFYVNVRINTLEIVFFKQKHSPTRYMVLGYSA